MLRIFLILLASLQATSLAAQEGPRTGTFFENDDMKIAVAPRTPDQMAAFYEARGFPPEAIERIRKTCFVTVYVKNRSDRVLWLELERWQFTSNGKQLPHLDKTYWDAQWDEIDLRQASRSTFGWTQLPLVRDLRPGEPVGGNVVLPGGTDSFNIDARFHSGADKTGESVRLGFGNIPCPQDTPAR